MQHAATFFVANLRSAKLLSAGLFAGVAVLTFGAPTAQAQSATLTTLHSFTLGSDGGFPAAGLILGNDGSTLYGTTSGGAGTVFTISPSGTLTTLASFDYTNGSDPISGVIQGSDGALYGTTLYGGIYGYGTVYKVSPNSVLGTVVSFTGYPNQGAASYGGLMQGSDGNFYGTTTQGGSGSCYINATTIGGCGSVFRLTPEGVLTTLHSFAVSDGYGPYAPLIEGRDGNFYGTTAAGGAGNGGTVFRITPSGTLTTLHSFTAFSTTEGYGSMAPLLEGSDGTLYGTTVSGGSGGGGTVFMLSPAGTLSTLVSFNYANGAGPHAGLILGSDGNFYGSTEGGAIGTYGTLFELTPSGALTTLHTFDSADGSGPVHSLVQGSDGSFYGTTMFGGAAADGTAFKLTVSPTPYVPTGLIATASSRGKARLSWTASADAVSYNVYQGSASGLESHTPILTGITTTTVTVKKLTKGQIYCFTVAAVNPTGTSVPSNEACITAK